MGVSKIRGTILGGPHSKDYHIMGSLLSSPYLWKFPNVKTLQLPDSSEDAKKGPFISAPEEEGGANHQPLALHLNHMIVSTFFSISLNAPIWVVVKIMIPFLGTLNIRCRIIIGIQKGTIILKTTHITAFLFGPSQISGPLQRQASNLKDLHNPQTSKSLCRIYLVSQKSNPYMF